MNMAVASDGRYYATADFKGKAGKAAQEKFEAKAAEAQEANPKSDPSVVDAPKPDGDPQVRDNAGSTVPLTGDNVNPVTEKKSAKK
jgi:hypothetical protein